MWQTGWIVTDLEKNVHFIYRLFATIERWNRSSSLSPIFVNSSLGNPSVGYSIQQREMNKGAKSMTFSNRRRTCTTRWNGKRKLGVSIAISKNSLIMLNPCFYAFKYFHFNSTFCLLTPILQQAELFRAWGCRSAETLACNSKRGIIWSS